MTLPQDDTDWIDQNIGTPTTNANGDPLPWEAENEDDTATIAEQIFTNSNEEGGEYDMSEFQDYAGYEVPKGGGGDFWKPKTGSNIIRLATKFIELRSHEIKGNKFATEPCPGEGCEKCANGERIKFGYAYTIIDRADGKVYLYEAPVTVFQSIYGLATNKAWGDPTQYDLELNKTGEGKDTRYQVIPQPDKTELTEAEVAEVAKIDMTGFYANRGKAEPAKK